LKLFDTLNDETNWSQISGALDGVGCVFQMGRSAPCFFGIGPQKMGHSFGFNQREKERLGGLEPWSVQWEGRELPLSYNMISVPLVYVIPLINILMEHHPHLNLENKKGVPMGFEPWSP
jgi:hypothetical protein